MVIAGYAIAKGRQPFINTLNHQLIRQAVPQMLKLYKSSKAQGGHDKLGYYIMANWDTISQPIQPI
jgi:hypothetical protein